MSQLKLYRVGLTNEIKTYYGIPDPYYFIWTKKDLSNISDPDTVKTIIEIITEDYKLSDNQIVFSSELVTIVKEGIDLIPCLESITYLIDYTE